MGGKGVLGDKSSGCVVHCDLECLATRLVSHGESFPDGMIQGGGLPSPMGFVASVGSVIKRLESSIGQVYLGPSVDGRI